MQAASGAGGKAWEILSYTNKPAQTRDYDNSSTGTVTINGYWPKPDGFSENTWPYNNNRAAGDTAITATWAPSTIPWHRFGQMGRRAFDDHTETDSGANTRTKQGDGDGWYSAAYNKTNLTKVALVGDEGTVDLEEPTNSTNHLVYDLVGTSGETDDSDAGTGDYTVISLLQTLSQYNQDNSKWHGSGGAGEPNNQLFNGPDSRNFTSGGGSKTGAGFSGVCTSAAGKMHPIWSSTDKIHRYEYPNLFAFWGVNLDSDHDTQVCVAYHAGSNGNTYGGWDAIGRTNQMGSLQTQTNTLKADNWRNAQAIYTYWCMWNNDWHSNSQRQNIGGHYNASWDEDTATTLEQTPGGVDQYKNEGTSTKVSSDTTKKTWYISMQSPPGIMTPSATDPKDETGASVNPFAFMCKKIYFLGYSE